jgi:hypothetical protein
MSKKKATETEESTVEQKVATLSAFDRSNLATLNAKLQMVRDFTGSVAEGRTTGFYLFGPGGCGKSFSILGELQRRGLPYRLFNSRMTGRGLYNALEAYPDGIHVLEDMEQLFRDGGAKGVLRSALWSQAGSDSRRPLERLVTWTTYKTEHKFVFTGGIIMTANRSFPPDPALDAIKTRIAYMHLVVSDNELIALMRDVSSRGYCDGSEEMEPEECLEVCEHLIRQSQGLHRQMDVRTLINGFKDFMQWRDYGTGCHWRDMVATRVKERPIALEETMTCVERAVEKRRDQDIARKIAATTPDRQERLRLWKEQTNKSQATLYRWLRKLKDSSLSDSQ